jgi:hypothetical protein
MPRREAAVTFRRWWRRLGIVASLWAVPWIGAAGLPETPARGSVSKEYQVKAACLFNFAQFVEWPAAAFPKAETPICIGVLGEDPFGPVLEQIIHDETINNRKLVIRRSTREAELTSCHLLFVSKSEQGRVDQILATLNQASILTVGEMEQFAFRGGIINFFLEGSKVRFEINPAMAKRNGLKISSQLLKLGRVIGADQGKEKK